MKDHKFVSPATKLQKKKKKSSNKKPLLNSNRVKMLHKPTYEVFPMVGAKSLGDLSSKASTYKRLRN